MVKLGDKVVDIVTGFTGVAYCRTEYLAERTMIGVMPRSVDNKPSELRSFTEERLIAASIEELQRMKGEITSDETVDDLYPEYKGMEPGNFEGL